MYRFRILIISILFLFQNKSWAQNISGVINNYAAVTSIVGANIALATPAAFGPGARILLVQMKGTTVSTGNTSTFGDVVSMGGAGTFEFLDVLSVTGAQVATTTAPINTYNITSGSVQVVYVPTYCMPNVNALLTCLPWNPTTRTGGILALEAGTLTLNADIIANDMGFRGGTFATSNFCCNNGSYAGSAGVNGGKKGESISAYIANQDGLKGKQANGGGGGNCGNSGGGGGGNGGTGGLGGNQYSGCGNFDDRGVGGLGFAPSASALLMGGGGGGGFRDNGQVATAGGNGGGIIYIRANAIISNNRIISASGGSVTIIANDEGAGGGGGGGTIFIECNNYSGNLTVRTSGGTGGSTNNTVFTTECHGTGGGGGGGVFAFSPAALPPGVTYVSAGGLAGTVNNPVSSCFGTNFGATAGAAGSFITSISALIQSYNTPTLSIVQSNTICSGQSTTLTASGATTYSWNTGPVTAVISVTPPVTTQYTLTGANGTCSASIVHTVNVSNGPTVTVAGPTGLCSGKQATITAGGAANYSWNTGATTSSIVVSPSITTGYTVTGSSNGCSNSISHTITVTNTPTVTVTGPSTLCSGQTVTMTTSVYNGNTPAVVTPVPISPLGSYPFKIIGYNGACSDSATLFITVLVTPTITVTGTPTLCTGTTSTLTANGAASYSWNSGFTASTASSIIVGSPVATTVNYTVTGSLNGCTSNYIHTLTVIPVPTLAISGSTILCSGQSVTLGVASAATYTWNTGAGTSVINISPAASTTYSVIGANASCTASATRSITVVPSPTVNATAASPVICSGSSTQIHASGANTYSWSTGSTNTVITVAPLATQTYTVYGTSNNCSSSGPVTVSVIPTPTLLPASYSLCISISQATLIANGATTYSWSPSLGLSATGGAVVFANPTGSMVYTLQGFNGNCTSSTTVSVITYTVPTVSISSNVDYVCKGNGVTLSANGAATYTWEPGHLILGSFIVAPLATTAFTLFGNSGNQCSGMAIKTITVLSTPQLTGSESYLICKGSSTELQISGAEKYAWFPSTGLSSSTQNSVIAAPLSSQVYTIVGSNGIAPYVCTSQSTIEVVVFPQAVINITAPDSVCYGQKTSLLASGAKDYTWSPTTFLNNATIANPVVTPTASIVYTVMGFGPASCIGTQIRRIIIKPLPLVDAGRDTSVNFDQPVMLNGQGDGWLYTWLGNNLGGLQCINCPVTSLQPQTSACYSLEVQNSHGCVARDEVCIEVTNDYAIYIPNSFTPGNDGLNDFFTPVGFGVPEFELSVFDRWGELLYSGKGSFTEGRLASWDGNYKGVKCKSDTYVYKFAYILRGGKKLSKEGPVLLLDRKN